MCNNFTANELANFVVQSLGHEYKYDGGRNAWRTKKSSASKRQREKRSCRGKVRVSLGLNRRLIPLPRLFHLHAGGITRN